MAYAEERPRAALEDLIRVAAETGDTMRKFTALLAGQPVEARLSHLRATVRKIGSTFPRRPVTDARYMVQWNRLVSGHGENLDEGTMRYLCWEPDIATSNRFLLYLQGSGMELTARPLAGLVRSCQSKWEGPFPSSKPVELIRDFVGSYEGPSPVIWKWQSNLNAVLGRNGPEMLGLSFVEEGRTLRAFLEAWYLDSRSPFVHKVVEAATACCRHRLAQPSRGLLEMLFGELLIWPGWRLPLFKREIAELILHGAAVGQVREVLQKFILIHNDLGDPRLPANRMKWADLPREAGNRMLLWLSENPFSFFDHIHKEGKGWTWQCRGEGPDEVPEPDAFYPYHPT
jgi:hypothetical protein